MKTRNIIALVLVVLIFFFQNTYAAGDSKDKNKYFEKEARTLEKVGIIKGDKDKNLHLEANLKRKDVPIIISRLYSEEEKAKKSNYKISFEDIKKDDYFYSYVAWAVEKKLIKGISDEEFGANENVTLKEVEVILLRTLGYEEEAKTWNLIEPLSLSLGLRDGLDIASGKNPEINRGELSKLIVNALSIECKGSTLKLKDILNIDI
ncbi:S-layer homology domain-containing protein [uncultured Ezakiella sp.]|uniref:S-layer homology domain-containing protein n=1 Tax=uncultured Ezakiella sp. TaxID=1637529 RepID=UPI0025EBA3EC|nr:S-layer homology domain-containing protein [uncultured Ezakiella sp.]